MNPQSGLDDILPLSPLQDGLLFHALLDTKGFDPYTCLLILDLEGAPDAPLDPAAVRAAGQALLDRHANLRAAFRQRKSGDSVALIPRHVQLPWREVDLCAVEPAARDREFAGLVAQERKRRFDPATPPLLRSTLVRLGADRYRLVLTHHHILLDGWSTPVLVRDLRALYAQHGGHAHHTALATLPPPTPYRDYLGWLATRDRDSARAAWREALAGLDGPTLVAPVDHTRTPQPPRMLTRTLSAETTRRLIDHARHSGWTINTVLQAAWAIVLGRLTGRDDVVFGTTLSGRPPELPGVADMIGLFINTVPVRLRLSPGESVRTVLRRLQDKQIQLLDHQHLGLAEVQQLAGHSQLFDTMMVLQNWPDFPDADAAHTGLRLRVLDHQGTAHYPVSMTVWPGAEFELQLNHQTGAIDGNTADRLIVWFLRVLEGIAADPEQPVLDLEVLTVAEREQLLHGWNDTTVEVLPSTLTELLAAQAARTPDATAVVAEGVQLCYAELNRAANRLARQLISRGVGPEQVVALALPRSVELVVAVLAVAKAGGAYLPVDLDYPADRIVFMLDDAAPVAVLATTGTASALPISYLDRLLLINDPAINDPVIDDPAVRAELDDPDSADLTDLDRGGRLRAGNAAYVIYTSGSTGQPKGVVVSHAGIASLVATAVDRLGVGPDSRILQFASISFDVAVWDVCMALGTGATLVVVPESRRIPGPELTDYAHQHAITHMILPPSLMAALPADATLPAGATLLMGTETVPPPLVTRWSTQLRVFAAYGLTETTVNSTLWPAAPGWTGHRVPIGRPDPNTRVYVLDAALRLTPPGTTGELYITGDGLARGYLNRPALTAARFVADPYGPPGARLYRTGDLARWHEDGVLNFLGRSDDQVKIRGYRIEPGEIETTLSTHPAVAHSAVIARADPPHATRLVAYIVPAQPTNGGPSGELAQEQIGEWQQIYDTEYAKLGTALFTADFSGWTSSYDGEPIPLPDMLEWRDAIVERIRELRPDRNSGGRILEIGVGTGLLLSQLAHDCDSYWGTDFSAPVIDKLRDDLRGDPDLARRVELRCQPADVTDGLPSGFFDIVIINSVIQYFPNVDYLTDVLAKALDRAAPTGVVFVGDVRNQRLARCFHTATQLSRIDHTADPGQVRRAIERSILLEKELLVDPGYFAGLPERLSDIGAVDLRIKRGRHHNELTRYRYDVTLHKAPTTVIRLDDVPRLSWGTQITSLDELSGHLTDNQPAQLRVTRILNPRLGSEVVAMRELDNSHAIVDVLDRLHTTNGTEPETLHELGNHLGYQVICTWSDSGDESYDAVFLATGPTTSTAISGTYQPTTAARKPLSSYANNPGANREITNLVPLLRTHLKQHLPEYMVPAAFVVIDRLPIAANGKLDRAALPAPEVRGTSSRAPRSAQEEMLCELFAEVLGLDRVGVDDSFFDLGGHSLLAIRLISRARTALGAELAIRDLFEAPTVAELAQRAVPGEPTRPALTPASPRPERIPLSAAQQRLWLVDRLAEGSLAYHYPLAFRLRGQLDVDALNAAVHDVMVRHESLRTVIDEHEGMAFQRILGAESTQHDLAVTECTEDQLADRVGMFTDRPFDLRRDPPLRVGAFRLAPEDHVVVLALHHIGTDEWSDRPLFDDLGTAYAARCAGTEPGWAPLPAQYADYTLWQQQLLGDPADPESVAARQLAYWVDALRDIPGEIALPLDRPRPTVRDGSGAQVQVDVPGDTCTALHALCAQTGSSMSMLTHAVTAVLLHRLGAGTDIPLGVPTAGRTDEALEDLVGFFVNTLVLRSDLSGDPGFIELLTQTRERHLAAFEHQDLPFEQVVGALNPARVAGRNPLFQVMTGYLHSPESSQELLGLPAERYPTPSRQAMFDLDFTFVDEVAQDGTRRIRLLLDYATDLTDPPTAQRLAHRMVRLLEQVATDPDQPISRLGMFVDGERHLVTEGWNDTVRPVGSRSMAAVFSELAATHPDRSALVCGESRVTFGELAAKAGRIARLLQRRGVGPETVVGLALPRAESVPAILGVLAAGAAYLPLDPNHPADRLQFMLADAAPACVLTTSDIHDRLPATEVDLVDIDGPAVLAEPAEWPLDVAGLGWPEQAAYVLYTSGSTGRPKAVVGCRRGLTNLFRSHQQDLMRPAHEATGRDRYRVLHAASFSFDGSWEPLLWLFAGHELHVVPEEIMLDPAALVAYIENECLDFVDLTPTYLRELLNLGFLAHGRRRPAVLLVGGEATPPELWAQLRDLPGTTAHDLYGPTEYTVDAYGWHGASGIGDNPADRRSGAPIANTRCYVLDTRLEPVPIGVPGELYLAGDGLTRGYLRRPDVTAGRFVAHLYGAPGSRMYRTGDVVRRLDDGTLEFLGRADDQVKLRGFRIEPGEIEDVLRGHPAVAQVAVVVRTDLPGVPHLVAYVVPTPGFECDPAALRAHSAGQLPEHMVPAAFVPLPSLPRSVAGKLDRAALPAPDLAGLVCDRGPRSAREELLCEVFADVLGLERVGIDDDFFALGGHSLLAMRLVSRLNKALRAAVSLRSVFDAPTVAAMAQWLARQRDSIRPRPALSARQRRAQLPLSFAQQRMWVQYQVEGPSPTYNIPVAWRLSGPLDVEALRAAVGDLVERHEALRTIFPERNGWAYQHILDSATVEFIVEQVERHQVARRLSEAARYGFALDREPPLKVWVFHTDPTEYTVLLLVHHIATDEWSDGPLTRDLATAYAARITGSAPGWPPLTVQYADYALWQREVLDDEPDEGDEQDHGSVATRQLAYWAETLTGLPEEITLPTDRPRPQTSSNRGGVVPLALPPDLVRGLRALAREHDVSVFMLLHAAVAAFLHRIGAGPDIVIGSPIAGRDDEQLDDLIGLFLNTLVLRTDLSGQPTFAELLARVRDGDLAAYDHQDVPFDRVVEVLNPKRSLSRHPLFQVMIVHLPAGAGGAGLELPGLRVQETPVELDRAMFDLSFEFVEQSGTDELLGGLIYSADLFDKATVETLVRWLIRLLESITTDSGQLVGQIEILSATERDQVLGTFNDTGREVVELSWPAAFETQVGAAPDAIAVLCADDLLTYAELNSRANRLARLLVARGVQAEDVVAVAVPRSVEMVVALLGVMKAGAAYLPLDLDYPGDRVAFMLADTGARLVVSTSEQVSARANRPDIEHVLLDDAAVTAELAELDDNNLEAAAPRGLSHAAYVIYTSGSTGRPKGVIVNHEGIGSLVATAVDRLGVDEHSRVVQFASVSFDVAVWDLCMSLCVGGRAIIVPAQLRFAGTELTDYLTEQGATHMILPPSLVAALPADCELPEGAVLVVGTETVPTTLLTRWATKMTMIAAYGLTEATVNSTLWVAEPDWTGPVPIGGPDPNTRTYVLDDVLRPVGVGVPGELYVGGRGLARGYRGRPDLTAERFVADPFAAPGLRMYRTGDRARWRADGTLDFLGRADQQIKIRGYRIEPGEIQARLMRHPDVRQAAVIDRHDPPHPTRLVAYIVSTAGTEPDMRALRHHVAVALPDYMVPNAMVAIPALPLTPSGKLDRAALPPPDLTLLAGNRQPSTPQETTLCRLFADVLDLPTIGIDDNFFELGGDSLSAARVMFRIRSAFDVDIPLRELFARQTVAGLTEIITALQRGEHPTAPARSRAPALTDEWNSASYENIPPRSPQRGARILLTGPTGFFGAFLLRELLAQTEGVVVCLVRARNVQHAWDRLQQNLDKYGLGDALPLARVSVIAGDLAKSRLGLSDDVYERLANEIDTICHNGAHVDALFPYEQLKAANVGGTHQLLRLATTTWLKDFHFVSTVSVESLAALESDGEELSESGYVESKWQAEKVVATARSYGVSASIYRIPRLVGDSQTGLGNDRDIMLRTLHWILQVGAAPDIELNEVWISVDEAAELLVSTMIEPRKEWCFTMTTEQTISLSELLEIVREAGREISIKTVQEWERELFMRSPEEYEVMSSAFATDHSAHTTEVAERITAARHRPQFDDFTPLPAPGIDEKTIRRYLRLNLPIELE